MVLYRNSNSWKLLASSALILSQGVCIAQMPTPSPCACAEETGHCSNGNENPCAKAPPGAIPRVNGTYVRLWEAAQTNKAAMDKFVIYRNEWFRGGNELGPYGKRHLNQILRCFPDVLFAVVIEPALGNDV